VGNYKGVMLCNRPFGGITASVKGIPGGGEGKTQFACGVVPEMLGQNVPISGKEKMTKRPNKDSVLVKHKKWLAELQRTKERLTEEYIQETRKKEEEQLKFQEQQKQMRIMTKEILRETKDEKDSKDAPMDSSSKGEADDDRAAQAKHTSSSNSQLHSKQSKPAWAMTEKAADNQKEELQEQEENLLLDFAQSLDFDKYIGDIEVQTMMERLRKRITELEKEVVQEELRSADADSRAALKAKLELMGETENALKNEGVKQSAESEAMQVARALLQDEEDMQAVHSTRSVASLLRQAKDKIEAVRASVNPDPSFPTEHRVLNEPKVVFHDPSEGTRLHGKNEISNLPYMHRNPAV